MGFGSPVKGFGFRSSVHVVGANSLLKQIGEIGTEAKLSEIEGQK